jgi:predicted transcriptional regulator
VRGGIAEGGFMLEKRKKKKEIKVRLPDELHARLAKIAKFHNRSITVQTEWYIEQGLQKDEPESSIIKKEKIGEALIRRGKMTKEEAQDTLRVQRDKYSYSRRFGEIAVEMKIIDQKTLDDYLDGKNVK